jgi:hydroxyacylglutathione hydrolase
MSNIRVRPIETPTLGDRSYLVHDGEVGFVVDPQRDIDRVFDLIESEGVRITDIFETHIHNDYLTGGLALAARTGATYHVNVDDDVAYERSPIRADDTVRVGEHLTVRAIATPGHTFTHLSYAVEDDGQPVGVFTGGSLLFGATGRRGSSTAPPTDSPRRCPMTRTSSRPTASAASARRATPRRPSRRSARRSAATRR